MRRREFIAFVAAAASSWVVPGYGQQHGRSPVVGYLSTASAAGFVQLVEAFRRGLSEEGFIEGRNLSIEYRWAEGHNDRLADLAADLVRRGVAAIAATGGSDAALVAKAATSSIPIVFTGGGDAIRRGLVESLRRPGGNATGVINLSPELTAKRLQLLCELVGDPAPVAVLINPSSPASKTQVEEVEQGALVLGRAVYAVEANTEGELDGAFAEIARRQTSAVFVTADPLFTSSRPRLVALAAAHRLPASYAFRQIAVAGGLMSYGANLTDVHRVAGVYLGRILKGEKPGELPVVLPTKFELVLNVKTARSLGLTIPPSLLARADEVIE